MLSIYGDSDASKVSTISSGGLKRKTVLVNALNELFEFFWKWINWKIIWEAFCKPNKKPIYQMASSEMIKIICKITRPSTVSFFPYVLLFIDSRIDV